MRIVARSLTFFYNSRMPPFIVSAANTIVRILLQSLPSLLPLFIMLGFQWSTTKLDEHEENRRQRKKQRKEQDLRKLLASGEINESDYRFRIFQDVIIPEGMLVSRWAATELPKQVHGCYLLRDQLDKTIELYSHGITTLDQEKSARYASYLACAKAYKLCLNLDVEPPNLNMFRAITNSNQAAINSEQQIKRTKGGERKVRKFARKVVEQNDLDYMDPVYCEWIVKEYCWATGEKSANIFETYSREWHEEWARSYPLNSARGWEVKAFPHTGPDAIAWTKVAWITIAELAHIAQCNDTGHVISPRAFLASAINHRMTLGQFETDVLPELSRRYWLIIERVEQFEKKFRYMYTENLSDDETKSLDNAKTEIANFKERLADRHGLNCLDENGRWWNYWTTCKVLDDEKGIIAQTLFLLEEYSLAYDKSPEDLLLPKPDMSSDESAPAFEELDDALSRVKITGDRIRAVNEATRVKRLANRRPTQYR